MLFPSSGLWSNLDATNWNGQNSGTTWRGLLSLCELIAKRGSQPSAEGRDFIASDFDPPERSERLNVDHPDRPDRRTFADSSAIAEKPATPALAIAGESKSLSPARSLLCWSTVMLKIETIPGTDCTSIRLIGRLRAECLPELRAQIEGSGSAIVLEMDEVTLVDVDVVRFLIGCEAQGIQLRCCSAYIREWIARERERAT